MPSEKTPSVRENAYQPVFNRGALDPVIVWDLAYFGWDINKEQLWVSPKKVSLADFYQQAGGPVVEVGGPTAEGFELIDMLGDTGDPVLARQHKIVSNLDTGVLSYAFNEDGDYGLVRDTNIHMRQDATRLAHADSSVGVFEASCLPRNMRQHFFDDAKRALVANGLLVYQGAVADDIGHLLDLGLSPVAGMVQNDEHMQLPIEQTYPAFNVVFMKK